MGVLHLKGSLGILGVVSHLKATWKMKCVTVLCCLVGLVQGNDYDTVGKHCDHNGDKRLNMAEFSCIFMRFDKGAYDGYVDEHEFEEGWKHLELHYKERAPLFFIETDVTGDFRVGQDDMAYLKA